MFVPVDSKGWQLNAAAWLSQPCFWSPHFLDPNPVATPCQWHYLGQPISVAPSSGFLICKMRSRAETMQLCKVQGSYCRRCQVHEYLVDTSADCIMPTLVLLPNSTVSPLKCKVSGSVLIVVGLCHVVGRSRTHLTSGTQRGRSPLAPTVLPRQRVPKDGRQTCNLLLRSLLLCLP